MPIMDAANDLGHTVLDDPNWSESYYFNAYSPADDVGFFSRIAIRPNEPHVDGFITVWLPGGGTARIAESRDQNVPDPDTPVLERLRFERVKAMEEWRIVGKGKDDDGRDLAIDATFQALSPAIGVDSSGRRVADAAATSVTHSLAAGHFEQAGTWTGEVVIDGVQHNFTGRGMRDKSWGPRRSDGGRGMHFWRWFSMNFGDEIHLGGIRVGTEHGDLQRGWLFRDGNRTSLRGLEISTELDDDGLRQRRISLAARDKEGEVHHIEGEVLRLEQLHARGHEQMAIFEGLTRWTYAGNTGYGVCEYAHKLDAAGRPVVPID